MTNLTITDEIETLIPGAHANIAKVMILTIARMDIGGCKYVRVDRMESGKVSFGMSKWMTRDEFFTRFADVFEHDPNKVDFWTVELCNSKVDEVEDFDADEWSFIVD